MILTNKAYDLLKWVATILLPALGALYFGLADIWDLPKAFEVVGTITVVDTFLGVVLKLSSNSYQSGHDPDSGSLKTTTADPETGMPGMALVVNKTPEELMGYQTLTFRVEKS